MERVSDPLTGLLTSAEFHHDIEALIVKSTPFAYILMDMDGLLAINSDFGHEIGDEVFRLVARHIKTVFTPPNGTYRQGGDSFCMLMPDTSKEEAFLKAEYVRRLIADDVLTTPDGRTVNQTVSIGVSSFPEDGSRTADIYRRAESAMVRAKKAGRNQVCLAREEKLIPKTSHYTQTQLEKLSVTAEKLGVGEAALLRESLDDLLKKYEVDWVK